MLTPVQEAGLEVPGFWPKLFVSAIADSNINELMMNVVATSPGGGAAAGGAAPAAAAAAPAAGGKPGENLETARSPALTDFLGSC